MFKTLYKLIATASIVASTGIASHAAEIEAFDMQRCVNMGNSLEAPRDAPWGAPINTDHFALIKAKGFDTVRIPARWSDYTAGAPDFKIESNFKRKVENIVVAALAQDLNVILNVHHFEEIMDDPISHTPKLVEMWRQISETFKDQPDSLWFEVINEPNGMLKAQPLLQLQHEAVETIRKTNPDRIVILGGEDWSGIRTLDTNMMPPDDNIVYTFHYYDPFAFTHQFAPWTGDAMPTEKRGWGSEKDRDELKDAVQTAVDFEKAIDRPVFVGEFGAYEKINNSERVQYVNDVRSAMEGAQIPWCLWSFSNTFPLYDTEKQAWDKDMLDALVSQEPRNITQVKSQSEITPQNENWGQFRSYYSGSTDFTSDTLTGVATINPGQEIHPPHKHIEEEYLMVLEGNGTWTIGENDFPAKTGDILYAAPWDLHGIKNTGTTPMKFVVFKYNKK
ncbi:MAG: cellulase family glycosylhydrolase [Hyphomonadaceae bacterium]|nr:cellulase family glycosylhydrolase [Hyphomonadaceae bacterium]